MTLSTRDKPKNVRGRPVFKFARLFGIDLHSEKLQGLPPPPQFSIIITQYSQSPVVSLNKEAGCAPLNWARGGGVLPENLGRGVRPASQNDQNLRFSLPYL